MTFTAIRSALLHCLRDPGLAGDASAIEYLPDAITVMREGRVHAVGPATTLLPTLGADVHVDDQRGRMLVPGFVDTHVHYPQVDVIASYGTQLLDWLNRYTFPAELAFAERAHADAAQGGDRVEGRRRSDISAIRQAVDPHLQPAIPLAWSPVKFWKVVDAPVN